jgi:dephospho-CoA kinase
MIKVGLTGNIASGKSLAAHRFAELGARIVDADVLGHRLIGPGGAAVRAVLDAFGPEFRSAAGGVDRARLGPVVFADPAALARLNALVHPLLVAGVRAELDRMASAADPPAVAVLDAALLYELGVDRDMDRVVVVTAPESLREARLVAKGVSVDEARRRIGAQRPEADKARRADHVIANDGSRGDFLARVEELWPILLATPPASGRKDDTP